MERFEVCGRSRAERGGMESVGRSAPPPCCSFSTYLQYRPQLVKAKIVAGATDPIGGGYDKVGLGGIDCASAHWSGYWFWWSGGTGAFSTFDGQDGAADNYAAKTVYISKSCNRVQRHPTARARGGRPIRGYKRM